MQLDCPMRNIRGYALQYIKWCDDLTMMTARSHLDEVQMASSNLSSTSENISLSDNTLLAAVADYDRQMLPCGVHTAVTDSCDTNKKSDRANVSATLPLIPLLLPPTAVDFTSSSTHTQWHREESLLNMHTTEQRTNAIPQWHATGFNCEDAHILTLSDGESRHRRRRTNSQAVSAADSGVECDLLLPDEHCNTDVECCGTVRQERITLNERSRFAVSQDETSFGIGIYSWQCELQRHMQQDSAARVSSTAVVSEAIVLRRNVTVAFATRTEKISALLRASNDALTAIHEAEPLWIVMNKANTVALREFLMQRTEQHRALENNFLQRAFSGEFVPPDLVVAELKYICDAAATELSICIQSAARELQNIVTDRETNATVQDVAALHTTQLRQCVRKASLID